MRGKWLICAAVTFACLPLSWQRSPSSSLPQLTTAKAEAVTYRRARVTYRRAYRRGTRQAIRYGGYHAGAAVPAYYAGQDGHGGYPYSAPYYAYRHVYAPPLGFGFGWGRGWGWGRRW
jgi:hypothetical protein